MQILAIDHFAKDLQLAAFDEHCRRHLRHRRQNEDRAHLAHDHFRQGPHRPHLHFGFLMDITAIIKKMKMTKKKSYFFGIGKPAIGGARGSLGLLGWPRFGFRGHVPLLWPSSWHNPQRFTRWIRWDACSKFGALSISDMS